MIELFEKMLQQHIDHLVRLRMWHDGGAHLENFPGGETLEDFIAREELAVSNIQRAIQLLNDEVR